MAVNRLVSVIVTTRNEEAVLERLLKSIKDQTYEKIEIIVVDNKSSDETQNIAEKFTDKVFNKGPERSAQRNFGVKKAKGDYVLILDADMQLSRGLIKECVETINKSKDLGGLVIPEISVANTFWERVKAFERSFYNEKGDASVDAARFFRKKAFNEVGGYDETITGPEDWDLPERIIKAGYKIGRVSSKIKHFEKIENPFNLAKKKYYYALTSYRYLKKHDISPISSKTIYFLRPVFYKQPVKLISNPIMTLGMFFMFTIELIAGGTGYIRGKLLKL